MQRQQDTKTREWTFTFGHEELVVHRRYEVLSMLNDFLLGLWFSVGSVCFFFEGGVRDAGVWLFLLGSVQLLVRPAIRLHRYIRFKHLPDANQDN
ncbi:YrhK family protein [Halomonas aquamarina]|uniref:YrhK family protein n=1 Tax=Vreelandella aquamarina TaxID=77097 RepID=A0ACC5VW80_9GAMM|nr:YrhK family protein [Halomonas aquamarina]MBZ5488516.1 YrhK family protein [Halomonas aquamarina]